MIEFKYHYPPTENVSSGYTVTIELSHDECIDEIVRCFEGFLHAAGYPMDGRQLVIEEKKIAEELR